MRVLLGLVCLLHFYLLPVFAAPNIIFILADDLGFNDVGFHGQNQIPTPNIDALAYDGVILNNYYVHPLCTPSRSALMTGKYATHTGMQHTVLYGAEPRGLPLSEKILPQYLKDFGYTTRIVGKWHLGNFQKVYTPTFRGFDSHLGYWTGHHDYFDHTAMETGFWGLDIRRNLDVAYDTHGYYSTDLFTTEAIKVINEHNKTNPLFLYLAHAAVHSGNPYNPLPAPDDTVAKFGNITDFNRRKFAAILSHLDDSVGQVVAALAKQNMLKDSIIIFSSDNGGPAAGFNLNAASNWPLRGVKNTLWEGGVRAAGLIWSPLLNKTNRVSQQLMHVSDWLPTLYSAIGGNVGDLGKIDGIDQWNSLSNDLVSERKSILHLIDDIYGEYSLVMDGWKIISGTTYDGTWDGWYGPPGRESELNITKIIQSQSSLALQTISRKLDAETIENLLKKSQITCNVSTTIDIPCNPLETPCLFNVYQDPCEKENLANKYPQILQTLLKEVGEMNKTVVPATNLPIDPQGDPKYWSYTWTNFGDSTHFTLRSL